MQLTEDLRERPLPLPRRARRRPTPAVDEAAAPPAELFSAATNAAVTALAFLSAAALAIYLLLVDAAASAPGGQPLSPRTALLFTAVFVGLGPLVVLNGQRRVEDLAQELAVDQQAPRWLLSGHARFVLALTAVATLFAWLPLRRLNDYGAFPMPGTSATAVYLLASAAAICLCSHGIFTAATFLRAAHSFGREPGHTLAALTRERCEQVFQRAHVYVAWSFSVVGALQLPVLLLFRPALPAASQAVAVLFIAILSLVGPLLFWLPRHWQRARLQEEAAAIVRDVAAGAPPSLLERLPAYDFWMQRLKTTGLSLTLPALAVAAVTHAEDLEFLLRVLSSLSG